MIRPSVSVIVPFYNEEKNIEKCFQSILVQSIFTEIEVLFINDGSTDDSLTILNDLVKPYDNIKIYNKENTGLSDSRNYGFLRSKGEYIYFLDSDDSIEPNCLERCLFLATHYSVPVVTFNSRVDNVGPFKEPNYSVRKYPPGIYSGYEYFCNSINQGILFPIVWLYFYKRDFLEDNQLVFKKILYEDSYFTLALCLKNPNIFYTDEILHVRTIKLNSITTSSKTLKHYEGAMETVYYLDELINAEKNERMKRALVGYYNNRFNFSRNIVKLISNYKVSFEFIKYGNQKRQLLSVRNFIKFQFFKIYTYLKAIKSITKKLIKF